jgi:hypothetical protein
MLIFGFTDTSLYTSFDNSFSVIRAYLCREQLETDILQLDQLLLKDTSYNFTPCGLTI